ncbi:MAG: ABC transporter permease [Betaproteobacteria bacterium]|nr:ABC transporter permease [Betaproteobacteria bacterium]
MLRYVIGKALAAALVVLIVSLIGFLLVFAAGDPAVKVAGEAGSALDADRLRTFYGLDRPILQQYWTWLAGFAGGDMGRSIYFDTSVAPALLKAFAVTLRLGALAIAFALLLGVPLGIAAAWKPDAWPDRIATAVALLGQAIPTFWLALMLMVVFSVHFNLLPASGLESWRGYVMPTIVLGLYSTPGLLRLTRAGMLEVLASDYLRTARAMGIALRTILFKYALRNAILPVVSLAAAQFGYVLAGSVVVESVFAIDGAGRLAWQSILRSDLAMVQALIVCFSGLYIVLTFVADTANAWLDPKLRHAGGGR